MPYINDRKAAVGILSVRKLDEYFAYTFNVIPWVYCISIVCNAHNSISIQNEQVTDCEYVLSLTDMNWLLFKILTWNSEADDNLFKESQPVRVSCLVLNTLQFWEFCIYSSFLFISLLFTRWAKFSLMLTYKNMKNIVGRNESNLKEMILV
jgi:hypothetical protein